MIQEKLNYSYSITFPINTKNNAPTVSRVLLELRVGSFLSWYFASSSLLNIFFNGTRKEHHQFKVNFVSFVLLINKMFLFSFCSNIDFVKT